MAFIGSMLGGGKQSSTLGATQDQLNTANGQVTNSYDQQQALLQQLQAQNGIGNQTNVFQQQQQLANQLQQQALGGGPNPAQDQLNQNTGNNIAAQSAMMAGQRNSSSNAGLAARNAANQGANMQQQATGQSATMQAQQQISAQQALAQQQQAMGATAGQQVGQLQNAHQGIAQTAIGNQNGLLNNANSQNSAAASANAATGKAIGSLLGAAGSAAGMFFGGPAGAVGAGALAGGLGGTEEHGYSAAPTGQVGGVALSPSQYKFSKGGQVPGKANVAGDSKANDTVNAKLSPGELVIPRSVVQQGPEAVLAFAKKVMEQHDG